VIIMTQPQPVSGNPVPDSMMQVGIVAKYSFLDYLRSRRFIILSIITVLIGVLLTVAVGWYRPLAFTSTSLGFYSSWWGNATTFLVILTGVFFGGDAISGEFQNKTGYFTIPNPIRRSSIYIGKWVAAFIASTVILALFTIITVGNGLFYFGLDIPYQFVESVLFTWLYLVSVLGFTFLFSALFKSSAISILVTIILFLFGFGIIELVVTNFAGVEPWFLLSYGSTIISYIFTVPYPPHVSTIDAGPFTLTTYVPTVPEGIAIMVIYFLVTVVLGLVLFERKEFT
jgi:ABC-2 type transport system permease protein